MVAQQVLELPHPFQRATRLSKRLGHGVIAGRIERHD
jgi:hypothetical protein